MPTTFSFAASMPRRAAGTFLVVAAVGIELQILGGADYPRIPPGLLVLLAAAGLVLFVSARWALVTATVATAFITVGGIVTPNLRDQLLEPGDALAFVGSAVQAAALVGALASCGLALGAAFGRRPAADAALH